MRKVYLSRTDRKFAGVLGGFAEAYNVDSTIVRLTYIFIMLVTGFFASVIVYLLAWWVLPERPAKKVEDSAWSQE